jgi:hypothetical protein
MYICRMRKNIDLPTPTVNKLIKLAKKKRTKVKLLIESVVIEYAAGRIKDSEGETLE